MSTAPMEKRSGLLLISLSLIWSSSFSITVIMAHSSYVDSSSSPSSTPAVHIVFTNIPKGEDPQAYNIRTLASVLGSEKAAKAALLYTYQTAASAFSASLTAKQVFQLSKQPGVLMVVPSRTVQLHSGSEGPQV